MNGLTSGTSAENVHAYALDGEIIGKIAFDAKGAELVGRDVRYGVAGSADEMVVRLRISFDAHAAVHRIDLVDDAELEKAADIVVNGGEGKRGVLGAGAFEDVIEIGVSGALEDRFVDGLALTGERQAVLPAGFPKLLEVHHSRLD